MYGAGTPEGAASDAAALGEPAGHAALPGTGTFSGTAAVGAVISYGTLSELDPLTTLPIVLTIVTDHSDPDTRMVAEILEIQLLEFPDDPIGDETTRR